MVAEQISRGARSAGHDGARFARYVWGDKSYWSFYSIAPASGRKVEPFLHLEAIAATACVVADRFTSVKQLAEGGHVRQLVTGIARSTPSVGWLVTRARWASFRRTKPLSKWGFERGTPIDRWYIERFLEKHQERVHGRALEVLEDLYASRFGAAEVDVVDIDQGNPLATIRGDLCRSGTLPAAAFDTILLTQTLQFLAGPSQGSGEPRGRVETRGHDAGHRACAQPCGGPNGPMALDAARTGGPHRWPWVCRVGGRPGQPAHQPGIPHGARHGGASSGGAMRRRSSLSRDRDGPVGQTRRSLVDRNVSRVITRRGEIVSMPRRLLRPLRLRLRTLRLPFGRVASDRRLLKDERASLGDQIAVVGSSLPTIQAVTDAQIDIVSANPFDRRVTVLSDALGAGSLPANRWSAVILVDPPPQVRVSILEAASVACLKGGAVVVLTDRNDPQFLAHRVRGRRQLTKIPT